MESIIQNVKDLDNDHRQWIESVLGCHLTENQKVIIRVVDVDVEPDEKTRRENIAKAAEIARQGRANAAAQGVTEEEAGEIIDEAIQHYRQQKRQQSQE